MISQFVLAESKVRIKSTEGYNMVNLTRLNDSKVVINADLIEFVESLPDTIVTMTTGQKIMVKESVEEVVRLVVEYKRSILVFHLNEKN